MLNRLKKNDKKGFTLVELIVVLIILAILAALLVPALKGYIDKAQEKQIVGETRQVVMAAQTMVDEAYAENKSIASPITDDTGSLKKSDIAKLAELPDGNITSITVTNGLVTKVEYIRNGKTCTYTKDSATAEAKFAF